MSREAPRTEGPLFCLARSFFPYTAVPVPGTAPPSAPPQGPAEDPNLGVLRSVLALLSQHSLPQLAPTLKVLEKTIAGLEEQANSEGAKEVIRE